jgi:hypothetical protein
MPGNPLVRFDEGRVGRTQVSPSLLLYRSSAAKDLKKIFSILLSLTDLSDSDKIGGTCAIRIRYLGGQFVRL